MAGPRPTTRSGPCNHAHTALHPHPPCPLATPTLHPTPSPTRDRQGGASLDAGLLVHISHFLISAAPRDVCEGADARNPAPTTTPRALGRPGPVSVGGEPLDQNDKQGGGSGGLGGPRVDLGLNTGVLAPRQDGRHSPAPWLRAHHWRAQLVAVLTPSSPPGLTPAVRLIRSGPTGRSADARTPSFPTSLPSC